MHYIKWVFVTAFWLFVLGFLHYTLPQRDVARISKTEVQRIDSGANSWFWAGGSAGTDPAQQSRDVSFIYTKLTNDEVMVYRNEDTGWSWPPYFKFDTDNLQGEAADLTSTPEAPKWVMITHYGWRNEFISIYPNAIAIRPVDGPDAAKGLPWVNIVILTVLAAVYWAIYVRWRRFRQARIDPHLEALEDAVDDRRAKMSGWFKGKS